MIDLAKIKIGDKVHYCPFHLPESKWENGVVKELPDHTMTAVRVVYNCAGNWDNFKDYTSALTDIRDLSLGWRIN